MNLIEIAHIIADPSKISSEQLSDINSLSEKYPYSGIFSFIYLVGLKKTGNIHFEDELNKHSYRVPDRAKLYRLLEGNEIVVENVLESNVNVSDELPNTDAVEPDNSLTLSSELIEQEEEHSHSEQIIEQIEAIHHEDEDIIDLSDDNDELVEEDDDETIIDSEEAEEPYFDYEFSIEELEGLEFVRVDQEESEEIEDKTTIDNSEKNISTALKTEETKSPEDLLEENIQLHIMSTGYHLEELTPEETERLENKKVEVKIEPEIQEESKEAEVKTVAESFIGWLHANKNFSAQPILNPETSRINVNSFAEFNPVDELSGDIDRPKKEFFSPSKKAKESLDESRLPVSETLAKIFVLQGNYPKAIQVYEQLMLNYPEKKVFFANSIEQIKEKINNIS